MKAEINIKIVEQLLKNQPSKKIVVKSFEVFVPKKGRRKRQLFIYLISIIMASFVGMASDTRGIMLDSTQTILDVMLTLFGIVFTGYAFFQALINKELLIRMIASTTKDKSKECEKSKLQESNESFVECMMLNLLTIVISLLLKILMKSMPSSFLLFNVLLLSNILATILISLYFYLILTVIWEVKSFIFNIFQLFNLHSGTRVLELFRDDDFDDKA